MNRIWQLFLEPLTSPEFLDALREDLENAAVAQYRLVRLLLKDESQEREAVRAQQQKENDGPDIYRAGCEGLFAPVEERYR